MLFKELKVWSTLMTMDVRSKKKIGLVLSGGGVKAAAFHIGVCLALKEKGFRFAGGTKDLARHVYPESDPLTIRLYVGSSAGSFVSAILAAGYDVESLINAFQIGSGKRLRYAQEHIKALKPLSYRHIFSMNGRSIMNYLPQSIFGRSLLTGGLEALVKSGFKINGLFTTGNIERYLRKYVLVENDFSRLGVELYLVASQLNHTRKAIFGPFPESYKDSSSVFINYASISEAVASSVALPPVYAPYEVRRPDGKGIYYYDGEIRETLSAHIAADHGCDLVISSYSVQPYHYTEEVGSLHQYGIPVILNQALYQVIQQKIAKHIEWNEKLKEIYNLVDQFFKQEGLPEISRKKLLAELEQKIHVKPNTDYVYIHPRAQNSDMFFADHFSLNQKTLEKVVGIGFKSALASLKNYGI
jgi:predicted acylesterase/phospholipase RssA